jgi:uncharacterized protein YggE
MKTLILFFSAWITFFPAMAQENDAKTPLIEVEGFSERKLTPDEAVFTIRLEEKSMKVSEAVNTLNAKTSKLAESLKKVNIQDYKLIADNYSVNINRIYRNGYAKDSGYIASQNLLIVTNSTNQDLQKIVETIQNAGDMSFNLNFQVSEKTLKSLEDTMLVEALKNAESRAQLIAQTFGIKTIRVNKVTLSADPIPYQKNMIMMRASAQDSEMLISPDQQIIEKRVYVQYTY